MVNALRIRCVLKLTERSCYIYSHHSIISNHTHSDPDHRACVFDDHFVIGLTMLLSLRHLFRSDACIHMIFEWFLGLYPIFGLFKGAHWNYRLPCLIENDFYIFHLVTRICVEKIKDHDIPFRPS